MKTNKNKSKNKNKNNKEILAYKIAITFNDMKHLALYLEFCEKYSRHSIMKIFNEVKEIPDKKIRKSKGALFTYLIQRFGEKIKVKNK